MSLWIANSLLLALVLVEVLIIKYHQKEEVPWREIASNLNSGQVVLWVFRGVEIAAFHLVLSYASLELLQDWNTIVVWIFSYLAWDFCFYWMHRLHHKYGALWAVHSIHHEGEHFSLSLGIRNSWYSSLTNFPFVVILAIIGVPLEVFITVSSINYFIQFYNHNGFIKKSGFLEYFLVTPSHHKVHHGSNDIYVDKNFGGTFIIWDQLFGTYQPEMESEPVQLGIHNHIRTDYVTLLNNLPILKYLGIKQKNPNASKNTGHIPAWVKGSSGILAFGLLLIFIAYEHVWDGNELAIFFVIVFLSSAASGAMLEQQKWGKWLWLGTGLALVLLVSFSIFSSGNIVLLTAAGVLLASGILFLCTPNKRTTSTQ